MNCSRIGARIREARKRQGMTQAQLADRLGDVSRNTIANWELGRIPDGPPSGKLACIAKIFEKPVEWFFEDGKEK